MNEELEKEQVEGGISVKEIFSALFKWKWIVLAVVVVCSLTTYLLTKFVINPGKTSYSYSFYVVFPDSNSETYPDGTPFDYRDIISSANLIATKEGNEAFKDVDIVRMEKAGDISIVRTKETDWEGELPTEFEVPSEYKYTVTVKSSYFKNGEVAAEFITSLAQYPLDYAIRVTNELNYKVNLEGYQNESNTRYSELLKYLKDQRAFIFARLDSLINIYGKDYIANGNSLDDWRLQAGFAFSTAIEEELQTELDYYSYVYKENEDSVLVKIALLERDNLVNKNIRTELVNQRKALLEEFTNGTILSLEIEAYNTKITALTETIETVEKDISVYYQSIHYKKIKENDTEKWVKMSGTELAESEKNINARKAEFEERLGAVYTALDKVADTCKSVNVAVYETESRLKVGTTGISIVNGINSMLITAIAFVLSFAGAWIVFYAVEKLRKNTKSRKEAKAQTESEKNQGNE